MGWCSQFKALFRKNWILWYRYLGGSICEIIFPAILMCLIVIVRQLVDDEYYPTKSYYDEPGAAYYLDSNVKGHTTLMTNSTVQKLGLYEASPFHSCAAFDRPIAGYVKSNSELMNSVLASLFEPDGAFSELNAALGGKFKTMEFSSHDELDDYVKHKDYETGDRPGLCFGIAIREYVGGFDVELRYDDNNFEGLETSKQQIPTPRLPIINNLVRIPDTESFWFYHTSGFTYLQYLITKKILDKHSGASQLTLGVTPIRTPDYIKDMFLSNSGQFLAFIVVLCYITPVFRIISFVVLEKEQKTREGMKMMGLKDSAYWCAFILYYFILMFVEAWILALIVMSTVYTHSNIFLMFLYFFIFGLSVLSFSIFIASLFNHARVASITGIMLYFASNIVMTLVEEPTVSETSKNLGCLLPTVAVSLGCVSFVSYESGQYAVNFSNASDIADNFRFQTALYMMFIDFFIYLLLGLYIENVLPSLTGVRKSPLFFLTSEFWTGEHSDLDPNKSAVAQDGKQEEEILYPNEHFQKVLEEYKAQEEANECLKIRGLNKYFAQKRAVCDFSVNMYKGHIFALLGPNGAGKTTTISMLTGLLPVSGGSAQYSNLSIFQQMEKTREMLGVCPQHDVLFDRLTPREHLEIFATFKGRSDTEQIKKDVDEILDDIALTDAQDTLACHLSGGQMRKLSIGIAFIGRSDMIFLDEPTSGIDLSARKGVWAMLKKYKANKVIILTTHYMEEAEELGDRIGIMTSGTLRCVGDPLFLKTVYGAGYNLVVAREDVAPSEEIPVRENITRFLTERMKEISMRREAGKEITYFLPKEESKRFKVFFRELDANLGALKIQTYGMTTNTLEEIFLRVARGEAQNKEEKFTRKKMTESFARSSTLPPSELDNYTIASEPEKPFISMFAVHFGAIFLKRWLMTFRNWLTLVNEILVPIILILFGFIITQIPTFFDADFRWFAADSYDTPQRPYINENGISGTTFEEFSANFRGGWEPVKYKVTPGTDQSIMSQMDAALFNDRFSEPFRYGSFYLKTMDRVTRKYEAVVFVNISSQDAAGAYTGLFCEALARYALGNSAFQLKFANAPFPLNYETRSKESATKGSMVANAIVIAFALVPASVISYIVREREDNLKHQQMISGVSILAYWLSNSVNDIVKTMIPCLFAIGMIYAFDVELESAWLIMLVFAFTIIPFTYFTSFFFTKENSAQTSTLLLHFFAGVVLSPIFTILNLFDSTRDIGKVLGWIFRVIPSFSLSYGISNISYKRLYAAMEDTAVPEDLSFDCAGGDLLFLCIAFPFYIILMTMIEGQMFDSISKKCEPAITGDSPQKIAPDKFVTREAEKCDHIDVNLSPPVVLARHLKKLFRISPTETVTAVNDISFSLNKGECLALLGTNGAGKSTTFKMLTMDELPTGGDVYIDGKEISSNFSLIRKQIGYGPQYESSFMSLTVRENLEYYGKIKGIPDDKRDKLIEKLIKEMRLEEYESIEAGQLSGGNKRKLTVAIALLGNPPIVLLDEVSTGIDPEAKRFMWHVIQRISTKNKNTAVILTTHSMEEAEYLCTSMAMMIGGSFCCLGTPTELKETYGKGYEVQVNIPLPSDKDETEFLQRYNIDVSSGKLDRDFILNLYNIAGMKELEKQLTNEGSAAHIQAELDSKKYVKPRTVINYILIEIQGKIFAKELVQIFKKVKMVEHIGNFYKYLIEKQEDKPLTIGFIFGVMQDLVEKHGIEQYSASQASLAQIFHTFARQAEYGRAIGQEEVIRAEDDNPALVVGPS